ncbi:hypothetical protein BZA70DRAFT_143178 [Myxozyma melibiosi]|uniref:Uncharacterized protein n=1 Tax=Myxozyma melibiosi TaxID=54550 RepID=A0ABR1F7K7_9ASCO
MSRLLTRTQTSWLRAAPSALLAARLSPSALNHRPLISSSSSFSTTSVVRSAPHDPSQTVVSTLTEITASSPGLPPSAFASSASSASSAVSSSSASDTFLYLGTKFTDLLHWIFIHTEPLGQASFKIFETVHSLTGLSWGAVIPITCILLRLTLTLPVALWSRQNSKRLSRLSMLSRSISTVIGSGVRKNAVKLLPKELDLETELPLKTAPREQINAFVTAPVSSDLARSSMMSFVKDNAAETQKLFKVHFIKSFAVGIAQMLILFFGSRGVAEYRMRVDMVASSGDTANQINEGLLWLSNLSEPDPLFILPVVFAATTFVNLEGIRIESEKVAAYRGTPSGPISLFFGMFAKTGAFSVCFLAFFYPVSYTVYWLASALYSLFQNAYLRHFYPFVPDNKLATPLNKPLNSHQIIKDLDADSLLKLAKSSRLP